MSRKLGIVFDESQIPAGWYQWVPAEMVEGELNSSSIWFADQASAALRCGGRAVWIWSQ